jgi:IS1 family transposase
MYINSALNFNPYFTNCNFLVFNRYYTRTASDDIEFLATDEWTVFQKVGGDQRTYVHWQKQTNA